VPQFQQPRSLSYDDAVDGCRQILWGLFKKMVIADWLAIAVNTVYAQPSAWSGPQLAVAAFFFAFQIYCDFSAYSDIAIGTARLFGFQLMRNFAFPYFSQNLAEFWRRWHISLSTWFRDYVYISLGGNRVGRHRLMFNIMVTFLLSGLWHGASWNFVIWGAIHGVGVIPVITGSREVLHAVDTPCGESLFPRPIVLVKVVVTFVITMLALVFFRAATFHDATLIIGRICTGWFQTGAYAFHALGWAGVAGVISIPNLLLVEWLTRQYPHPFHAITRWPRFVRWSIYTVVIWSIPWLLPPNTSAFIYFQF
jgi:D-alanyl-lipoteichoic acid acyltransferase DltB (MBOAT superfamily)